MSDPTPNPALSQVPGDLRKAYQSKKLRKLSHKQRLFVLHYCGGAHGNATEAADMAGYEGERTTLASIGCENLRKPKIRKAIDALLQSVVMSDLELIWRISEDAKANLGPALDLSNPDRPRVDLNKMEEAGLLHLVKEVETTTIVKASSRGEDVEVVKVKVKVVDPQAAKRDLARIKGLFKERVELTGKDGKDLTLGVGVDLSALTDDQLDLLEKAIEAIAGVGKGSG